MKIICNILRLCVVLLFSISGVSMAFAVPLVTSDITYFQTETTDFVQIDDTGFAARAPPVAVANVAITGGVTSIQGSAFALHGQESVAALFGSDGIANATNNALPIRPAAIQPAVFDTRLENLMDNIYKGVSNPNRVGDGTLADAVLNERLTGLPTNGLFHSTKAQDTINGLTNFIDNPGGALSIDIQEALLQRSLLRAAMGFE